MSKRNFKPTNVEDTVVETTEAVEAVVEKEVIPVIGVVTDCARLNIRSTPKKDNNGENIVGTIKAGTSVVINMDESKGGWYKVQANGMTGFAMKRYVAVN